MHFFDHLPVAIRPHLDSDARYCALSEPCLTNLLEFATDDRSAQCYSDTLSVRSGRFGPLQRILVLLIRASNDDIYI